MASCQNCGKSPCRGRFCMSRDCQAARQRAERRERNGVIEPTLCANCGAPTTVAGLASEVRFCSKQECRRARQRYDYDKRHADPSESRVEDRPCSACGTKLPVRPWRSTDSELGRWCRKKGCQDARNRNERVYESTRRYWQDEMPAIECPSCHLDIGVRKGFIHPNREILARTGKFEPCEAVGATVPDPDLMEFAKEDWLKAKALCRMDTDAPETGAEHGRRDAEQR